MIWSVLANHRLQNDESPCQQDKLAGIVYPVSGSGTELGLDTGVRYRLLFDRRKLAGFVGLRLGSYCALCYSAKRSPLGRARFFTDIYVTEI